MFLNLYNYFLNKIYYYKLSLLNNSIKNYVDKYLNIYIIKPDVLLKTEDLNYKNIDLYKFSNNKISQKNINERINIKNNLKYYFVNSIDCSYYLYEDFDSNIEQPFIITIWFLGEEIRIGCFINKELEKEKFNNILNLTTKRYGMFFSNNLLCKLNELDRFGYYLTEVIISKKNVSLYHINNIKYISHIFGTFLCQTLISFEDIKDN